MISVSVRQRRIVSFLLLLIITGLPILHFWQMSVLFLLLPARVLADKEFYIKRSHLMLTAVVFFSVLTLIGLIVPFLFFKTSFSRYVIFPYRLTITLVLVAIAHWLHVHKQRCINKNEGSLYKPIFITEP